MVSIPFKIQIHGSCSYAAGPEYLLRRLKICILTSSAACVTFYENLGTTTWTILMYVDM